MIGNTAVLSSKVFCYPPPNKCIVVFKKYLFAKQFFFLTLCFLILSLPVFSGEQKPLSLKQAINDSVQELFNNLPQGSTVAVYDFSTPNNAKKPELSEHIVEEIIKLFSRERPRFITVDRQRMEVVKKELDLHLSGDVDDETAKAIGKATGADFVITGSVTRVYRAYNISLRPITVDKKEVFPIADRDIKENDPEFSFYLLSKSNFRFSLGGRAGAALNFLTLSGDISGSVENPSPGFEPAVQAAFHFTGFFALQTELALSHDKVSYSGTETPGGAYTASFESYSLRLPLLLRFTYSPGIFSVSGFAGVGFSIPLGDMKLKSSLYEDSSYRFSLPPYYVGGVTLGLKLGPGVLFSDIRFSGDFAKTVIHDNSGTLALYSRNTLSFSLGYEYEFN